MRFDNSLSRLRGHDVATAVSIDIAACMPTIAGGTDRRHRIGLHLRDPGAHVTALRSAIRFGDGNRGRVPISAPPASLTYQRFKKASDSSSRVGTAFPVFAQMASWCRSQL